MRILSFGAALGGALVVFWAPVAGSLEVNTHVDLGWRDDNLEWNIAGDLNGENPNILSELTWDQVRGVQTRLHGELALDNGLFIRAMAGVSFIDDGQVQDSDYLFDGRNVEFSRALADGSGDRVFDNTIAVGFQFDWLDRTVNREIVLTPLIGYSLHEQDLTITNGQQVLNLLGPTGPINGLDSRYYANWEGPWVGLDISLRATDTARILFGIEYHDIEYDAQANWNLRTDFAHPKSFEQFADGDGLIVRIGTHHQKPGSRWYLRTNVEYSRWSTDHGLDRTFFADGTVVDTRLNRVRWESLGLSLGVGASF